MKPYLEENGRRPPGVKKLNARVLPYGNAIETYIYSDSLMRGVIYIINELLTIFYSKISDITFSTPGFTVEHDSTVSLVYVVISAGVVFVAIVVIIVVITVVFVQYNRHAIAG